MPSRRANSNAIGVQNSRWLNAAALTDFVLSNNIYPTSLDKVSAVDAVLMLIG